MKVQDYKSKIQFAEVEDAMNELVNNIKENISIGNLIFFDYWDYEDEYSHNQIDEFQRNFKDVAELYLDENYPNHFEVIYGADRIIVKTSY